MCQRLSFRSRQNPKKRRQKFCSNVKATKLKGNSKFNCLIAASIYNQKPVNFLTTGAGSIEWVEKERPVYNVESGKVEGMKFLCLNINDDYNNYMNLVDIADQLWEVYKLNRWLRNRKWWWSIFPTTPPVFCLVQNSSTNCQRFPNSTAL